MLTSTLFVTNIHCPSCVSYAQDILHPIAGIRKVDVSIVDHRIEVQHDDQTDLGNTIAEELLKAAFEVQHVTTVDDRGCKIKDEDFGQTHQRQVDKWPRFMSKAQRKHIDNCNACKAEMARKPERRSKRAWSSLIHARLRGGNQKMDGATETSSESASTSEAHPVVINIDRTSNQASQFKATISIGGMTCASCIVTITKELESMGMVHEVNVDLLSNRAVVVYAAPRNNIEKIVEAIEDVGYEADVDDVFALPVQTGSEKVTSASDKFRATLSVEGMTCSSCINTISDGVKDLSFVSFISVNLVGNSATVEFDGREHLDQILEKIDDLGYDASVVEVQELGPGNAAQTPTERTVTIQIEGMYCEHCPSNIMSAINTSFGSSIAVSQKPTLKEPRLTVTYTPSPPQLTARRLIFVINAAHEAFSASIYHAPTQEQRSQAMRHREQRNILLRLLFTFIVAIPTFIIGIVFMSLVSKSNKTRMWFEQPVGAGNVTRTTWALFVMTTPVMFFGADLFHTRALKEIRALWQPRSRTPILRRFYRFGSMNLLISAGTAVAYFSSVAVLALDATSQPDASGRSSSTYFDAVTFLSFFILIGRFLEAYSKAKTGDAVALLTNLKPKEATLIEEGSDEKATVTSKVSVDLLEVGDIVNVPHGNSPPTDGIVSQADTFLFDESSLTGESKPVKKTSGDKVFAGSVNVSQPVKIKVTEIGGTSMLDQIVEVVRKGQSKRAPIERVADVITGYFVPVITLIAISTWVIWLGLGQGGVLPKNWLDVKQGGWPFWSLEFAIAVFVVACPCGIGLAAPTALYVGGGLAAKYGILVQGGGEAFQEASNLDVIVFDKTGTLTEGEMQVTGFETINQDKSSQEEVGLAFALTTAMEESSTHPIAKAIATYCAGKGKEYPVVTIEKSTIKEVPGQGMTGLFEVKIKSRRSGAEVEEPSSILRYKAAIGNQRLLASAVETHAEEQGSNYFLEPLLLKYQHLGQSTAIFSLEEISESPSEEANSSSLRPNSVFAIADPLRPTTASVLETLRNEHKLEVHMCTGDNVNTARAIAAQIGIPPSNIRAGVLPQDKAAYVRELQTPPNGNGKRRVVAFVGDGTNDTPALSAADVSIALSSGSDVAIGTASFILLNSDLETILKLVKLARRVFRRVKMNFAWAGVYNVCLVPIAAGVTYPAGQWRLGPIWASAAMAASSVSVVLNSLALRIEIRKVLGLERERKHE